MYSTLMSEFWNEISSRLASRFDAIDDKDIAVTTDWSGFTVVDGEEGDFGYIEYSDAGGLVAVRSVYGGDIENVSFTTHGARILSARIAAVVADVLSKYDGGEHV